MSFTSWLYALQSALAPNRMKRTRRRQTPNNKGFRPHCEALEDRTVPTVLFPYQFGTETTLRDGGQRINSPDVYVVLWGSSWGSLVSPAAQQVFATTSAVVNGHYLDGLAQYGVNTTAHYKALVFDNTRDPDSGFSQQTLKNEINRLIAADQLPDPFVNPDKNLIFTMVTAPGITSDQVGAGGYNSFGLLGAGFAQGGAGYIWNGTGPSSAGLRDACSLIFSHELAECMTDPGGRGYRVNPGKGWPNPAANSNQIADYEGNRYSYRMPDTVLVQPYWSRNDNAWLVTDGNAQMMNVKPNWTGKSFNNYDVTINGAQLAGSEGDNLVIGKDAFGLTLTLNNERFQMDSGQLGTATANISKGLVQINDSPTMTGITVNGGTGTRVRVNATPAPVTVNDAGNVDVESTAAGTPVTITGRGNYNVNVGKTGSVTAIKGTIDVNSIGKGKAALNVDSSADFGGPVTVTNRYLSWLLGESPTITYRPTGLSALTLNTGHIGIFGNDITVKSTPSAPVTLNTGISRDVVNVRATSGPLTVNGQGGNDFVNVGLLGSVQGIGGPLNITNASGYSDVNLNDSADTTTHTVILYNSGPYTVISGLSLHGDISLGRFDVSTLTISAGPRGNAFRIHDTLPKFVDDANGIATTLTSIFTGAGADSVLVDGATGALAFDVQGAGQGRNAITIGSTATGLGGINGTIDITGDTAVANSLTIDDAASTVGRDYVMGSRFVQRLDKARIGFEHLSDLTLRAGMQNDRIVVQDTIPVTPGNSTLIAQSDGDDVIDVSRTTGALTIYAVGSSAITVGDAANSLDHLHGAISVVPSGSSVTLTLNDQAATTPQQLDVTPAVLATSFQRSGAANVQVVLNPLGQFNWSGGSGGNLVNVKAQSAVQSVFRMGDGGDVLNDGTAADTLVAGSVDVGALTVFGGTGADQLLIRDQGTATPQRYELYVSPLAGSETRGTLRAQDVAQRLLNWHYVVFEHLESVTLNAGGGGNSVKVAGTPADTSVRINTGALGDTIDMGRYAVPSSLADMRGPILLDGQGGQDQIAFNDQGTTTLEYYNLAANQLTRYDAKSVTDMAPISFAAFEAVALNVSSGGSVAAVLGSSAGSTVTVNGNAGGQDVFELNPAFSSYLGPIFFSGQTTDYAYYDDYFTASPQTYSVSTNPAFPQRLLLESTDAAPVAFDGLSQVVFYLPLVGGSAVNVKGVPTQTFLNMAVSGDAVTLGSFAPDLGGTLANIKGPVAVASYSPDNATALVLDDSGNADRTPKTVMLTPREGPFDYGDHIEGFAPGTVYWNTGAASTVTLRGGAADEAFALTTTAFTAAVSIDGNGGVNALDYSALPNGVVVNLPMHMATGLAGGIANIQNVIGSAGNDILVGNGGNVLTGGLGRDLLIAGAFASILNGGEDEDLLIGGTTNYDADPAALSAILAEWTSASDYATRVANLESGRNGAPILNADIVRSNGGGNTLSGTADLDFFFANVALDTLDRDSLTEELVSI